jgi:preprotein translocase subunit YajC
MGTQLLLAAAKPATTSSPDTTLLIFVVGIVIVMFFFYRSSQRRRQSAQTLQRQASNGSRIRTVHGIYGTIVDGDDRNVMIEVAPGVKIKMMRQAVGQVVPDDEPDGVLHTDTDQSSDWSDEHGSDDHLSDDHDSDEQSSDEHSSEEHSDLGR